MLCDDQLSSVVGQTFTTQEYSKTIRILKTIFWEELKSRSPILGAIESLKKEKLELVEQKRLNNLFNIINIKLENLENKSVDIDFINTEEFARMLFKILDKARVDYREKKLKYYAKMLINYSTIKFSKDFYKEGIIEKIGEYPEEHILVLNTVYNKHIENNDEKNRILKNRIICVKAK